MIKDNKVSEFEMNLYSGELTYKLRADSKVYHYTVADASMFYNDVNDSVLEINKEAKDSEQIKYDYIKGGQGSWIISMLPTVILIGALVLFWVFMMRRMNATMGTDKTMGNRYSCSSARY